MNFGVGTDQDYSLNLSMDIMLQEPENNGDIHDFQATVPVQWSLKSADGEDVDENFPFTLFTSAETTIGDKYESAELKLNYFPAPEGSPYNMVVEATDGTTTKSIAVEVNAETDVYVAEVGILAFRTNIHQIAKLVWPEIESTAWTINTINAVEDGKYVVVTTPVPSPTMQPNIRFHLRPATAEDSPQVVGAGWVVELVEAGD